MDQRNAQQRETPGLARALARMTDEQRLLLAGLQQGKTYQQIAQEHGWNTSTIRKWGMHLYHATGARSRVGIVAATLSVRDIAPSCFEEVARRYHLTAAELQVLVLAIQRPDLSRKGVSRELHLADATVRNRLNQIYRKMQVRNRTAAMRQALTLFQNTAPLMVQQK